MKEQGKSLKLNFVMNAILTVSSMIFPLITFQYVSQIILPEGTGKVSFAVSLVSYFNMFAQLGIPTYGIRACAAAREDRLELTRRAHELLCINLVMSAVSYAALFRAVFLIPSLREERTLYLITSATILLSAVGMEWLYKALEQYTYITVRSLLCKLIAMTAMFFLIREKEDYTVYGMLSVFASSAANIVNLLHAHRYIDMHPVGGYQFRRHFRAILVFFAMSCATTIYTNLDTVMLGLMTTETDVGYYDAAVRIKNVLVGVVTSLGTVLLPRASYYIKRGETEKFRYIGGKALNFVVLLAVPLSLYFILFARQGILLLSSEAYIPAVRPMQIVMPTLLFIGLTNILGIQILVPLGREKTVLVSEIAGAVTDLVLNALLIPRWASAGAAAGTLAAEAVVLLVQYAALRGQVSEFFRRVRYGKILLGLAAGCLASLWTLGLGWGNFAILALSACLFFGAYAGVLTLTGEPLVLEIERQVLAVIRNQPKR